MEVATAPNWIRAAVDPLGTFLDFAGHQSAYWSLDLFAHVVHTVSGSGKGFQSERWLDLECCCNNCFP